MTRYETLITRLENTLPSVNPEQLQQLMRSASPPLVVDVREASDHQLGAIVGSINLSRAKLEASIESHMSAADQKIILYCGSRGRSHLVCQTLREMGIDAAFLQGGLQNWLQYQK